VIDAASLAWPAERLPEALELLARRSGLAPRALPLAAPRSLPVGPWLERAAEWLGFEAESVEAAYSGVGRMIGGAAPAILDLGGEGHVLLLRGGRRSVTVVGRDLAPRRVPVECLRAAVCAPVERPLLPEIEGLLRSAAIAGRHRDGTRARLLEQRLGHARVGGCWLLRLSPGAPLRSLAASLRLGRRLLSIAALHAAAHVLWLLSWWMLGWSILQDRLDTGWLAAWALARATVIPLQLLVTWRAGGLAVEIGTMLKQRLLLGGLRLEPEAISREGVGQLLGRVIESEAVEQLAASGGLPAMLAILELVAAAAILALGAGGPLLLALLLAWLGLGLALAVRLHRCRADWTDLRLDLAHDLVEKMGGQRTRLAQEPQERRHDGEDEALARYLDRSREADGAAVLFGALLPRGWVVLGVMGLAPAFIGGASRGALAAGVAGVLLAHQALHRLGAGLSEVVGALVSWRRIAPLFRAAEHQEAAAPPGEEGGPRPAALEARGLVYRHPRRSRPVLQGCDLRIDPGDRLLLEGTSGAGKSTLGSLLAGLRAPQSGLLLLAGLDRTTLSSDTWRSRVVLAPQFHENHVLSGPFAFNLLMGRAWPPSPQDVADAEATCRGLGLQPLLDRMPAGLLQMVGETGWQLSHGERSRLYVARALLQRADVVVLDESFGALDPLTLEGVIRFAAERAPALMVIAHR